MTVNGFSLPPGTVFNLPEIVTQLPCDCHPDCAQLEQASTAMARPYLISYFGNAECADRYLRQRVGHYGCLCYPYTVAERAPAITGLQIAATLFDDVFSQPDVQASIQAATALHERWCAVFDGRYRPAPGPEENAGENAGQEAAFRLVHNAIQAAAAHMPASLARRALQAWRDVADSHLDEAALRSTFLTMDYHTYMEKRMTNFYGWWLTFHVEYAAGIDLGDLAGRDADLLAAQRAAIQHAALVNDLYSFPKELDAKEAMNVILLFLRRDRLELQHAVDKVVDLVHKAEQDFLSTRDHILRGELGRRPDIRVYLDGLGYIMTGNLRFTQASTRYLGDQHDGSQFSSGPVTLDPKPTVHTGCRAHEAEAEAGHDASVSSSP